MPRFLPRISILNALLLMTIVAMAIVIVQLWREVVPLRAEVRSLRQQAGVLAIDDPSAVQAVGVPTDVEDIYKWRVYVPNRRDVLLKAFFGGVEKTGFPATKTVIPLEAGEQLVTFRTHSKRSDEHTALAEVETPGQTLAVKLPYSSAELDGMFEVNQVTSQQLEVEGNVKLQLIRKRFAASSQSWSMVQDAPVPLPGFII